MAGGRGWGGGGGGAARGPKRRVIGAICRQRTMANTGLGGKACLWMQCCAGYARQRPHSCMLVRPTSA